MSRRVELSTAQLPPEGGRALLRIDGHCLALFEVAGSFHAIEDSCPHQGASLCGGKLVGRTIQCLAHGLRFDLASGYLLNSTQLRVTTYPIEVEQGRVFLNLPDPDCQP
ncbi:MAG: Rieske 2Fe-2S domain-containing protein [Pseudomonadota bacterium]